MDLDSLAAVRFFLCVLVFRFSELCWCSASPRCCTLAGEARRSRWNWAGEPDWGAGRWDCTWTRRCKLRSAARPTQTSPTCLWRRGRTGEAFYSTSSHSLCQITGIITMFFRPSVENPVSQLACRSRSLTLSVWPPAVWACRVEQRMQLWRLNPSTTRPWSSTGELPWSLWCSLCQ